MHDHSNKDADQLDRKAKELEQEAGRLEETARKIEDHAHDLERQAHEEEARREREHGDHDHDHGGGDHHHGLGVKITMVVNGQPVTIEATEQEKLSDVRQRALTETQNLAQPPENWEIKDEAGTVLDPDKRVGDYHFGKEATLFLSLKAGVAGADVTGR